MQILYHMHLWASGNLKPVYNIQFAVCYAYRKSTWKHSHSGIFISWTSNSPISQKLHPKVIFFWFASPPCQTLNPPPLWMPIEILAVRDIRILLDLGLVMIKKHTMEVVDIQCTAFESTHSIYKHVYLIEILIQDHESLSHKFHKSFFLKWIRNMTHIHTIRITINPHTFLLYRGNWYSQDTVCNGHP